jgi:hypothetical protein
MKKYVLVLFVICLLTCIQLYGEQYRGKTLFFRDLDTWAGVHQTLVYDSETDSYYLSR